MLEVSRLIRTVMEDAPKQIDLALCRQLSGQTPLDIRALRFLMDVLGVTKLVNPPIYACLDDNMEVWKEAKVAMITPEGGKSLWGKTRGFQDKGNGDTCKWDD